MTDVEAAGADKHTGAQEVYEVKSHGPAHEEEVKTDVHTQLCKAPYLPGLTDRRWRPA